MSNGLHVPADARETVWVFGLDLASAEAEAFVEGGPADNWPLKSVLGAESLRASHIEAFPASDLTGVGLPGYLVEGLGIDAEHVAADRARLQAANRHIVILRGPAFGGAEQTLTPRPPLEHLGTYQQIKTEQRLVPLPGTGAEHVVPPTPGVEPALPTRGGGRGLLGLIAAAVVVLVLAYLIFRDRAMTAPAGWAGILDDDESILWQGRPDGAVKWKTSHIFTGLFGLVFAGFALFWMIMASSAGGFFWMFGLIHFGVGIAIGIGPPFVSAWTRRNTWYTLTDRRAFIATDLPLRGRKLKSYPIDEDTPLGYEAGDPATIYFSHEMRRTKNGSRRHDIGFERIGDGAEVYALLRKVQRGVLARKGRDDA